MRITSLREERYKREETLQSNLKPVTNIKLIKDLDLGPNDNFYSHDEKKKINTV